MLLAGHELVSYTRERFVEKLAADYESSESQIIAWEETFRIFSQVIGANRLLKKADLIFEYEIPFSGGTRPDVLMFVRDALYIIEFKNRFWCRNDDIEQLAKYRDLITNYHSEGFKYKVKSVLLLNSGGERDSQRLGINIVSSSNFIRQWSAVKGKNLAPFLPAKEFLAGRYNPSRDIVTYACDTFSNKRIKGIEAPLLKQAEEAYSEIVRIINDAKSNNLHSLVMVSGEPGSGKSALALRLSHEFNGCYITKNPHFMKLVTSQLGHRSNIHNSYSILKEAIENNRYPEQNLVVIDEAQRMKEDWRVKKELRLEKDEIETLLFHIKNKHWSCTVAFFGPGQDLAPADIVDYTRWPATFVKTIPELRKKVFASKQLRDERGRLSGKPVQSLHLTCNIRANLDACFNRAITLILDEPGNPEIGAGIQKALNTGYRLFVTRDLEQAKLYVNDRYGHRGLSSCITSTLHCEGDKVLEWDSSRNFNILELMKRCDLDEMEHYDSGLCQFHVLGLEFNMPVLIWKADLLYYDNEWKYDLLDYVEKQDRLIYIHNAYRVLMTRGRDGIILYFPDAWRFNSTYNYFLSIGFLKLPAVSD